MNGYQIKLIALVAMFFDHFVMFLPSVFNPFLSSFLFVIGRVALPVFCFLSVESFFYTRDRIKYILRLYLWGFVMLLGNSFVVVFVTSYADHFLPLFDLNIFFMFAVNISALFCLDWLRKQYGLRFFLALVCYAFFIFLGVFTDGGFIMAYVFHVFYLFHNRKVVMPLVYSFICFVFFIIFPESTQWSLIAGLPFILLYNGQRGVGSKYFFYLFYPLHLWLLYSVSLLFE